MASIYVNLEEVSALLVNAGFEDASKCIRTHLIKKAEGGKKESKKKKEKVEKNIEEDEIVIILGYSKKENGDPKSHVLVGPLYKDEYNELRTVLVKLRGKLNKNLSIGRGWIFSASKLGDLEDTLHTFDIDYKKMALEKYISKEREYEVNKWGNQVHIQSNYVTVSLPMETGRTQMVAVGIQDTKSKKTGLSSLIGLDEEDREKCEEYNLPYLTPEMMKYLDLKKYGALNNLLPCIVSESDSDDSDEEDDL